MTTLPRRSILRGASWAAPAAVVAVAAPAVAASAERDLLVFTNTTATEGPQPNVVYVNLKVMTTQGAPVPGLVVTVRLLGTTRTTEYSLAPWGVTEMIQHEFPGVPRAQQVEVLFTATAPGVRTITSTVTLQTPTWWAEL